MCKWCKNTFENERVRFFMLIRSNLVANSFEHSFECGAFNANSISGKIAMSAWKHAVVNVNIKGEYLPAHTVEWSISYTVWERVNTS